MLYTPYTLYGCFGFHSQKPSLLVLAAKHYALGEISKEKYKKMTADYEAEQERLKLEIETTEEWVEQRQAMGDDLDTFIALTKKYVDVTELTQTIVNEYTRKIITRTGQV